ncbi:MAG TPA: YtxH domain-containing protein [Candidatus Dojkabacteria bacterium]|nr:YtxH domain-containing protein [Candidatus Dojkabacteria bacterium]
MNNGESFFKGLVLGVLAGAAAGLLLAPKKGEEMQKDLKKMLREFSEQATDVYEDAMKMVKQRLEDLKEAGSKIDQKKYMNIVDEVLAELKDDGEVASASFTKLSAQLKRDWKKVKTSFDNEKK